MKYIIILYCTLLVGCTFSATTSTSAAGHETKRGKYHEKDSDDVQSKLRIAKKNNEMTGRDKSSSAEAGPTSSDIGSTPTSTVREFLAAGSARDAARLRTVFSSTSPDEFAPFRDGTATDEELDSLAEFVKGAIIGDETIEPGGKSATVAVKFRARDEVIQLIMSQGVWQIEDF